MDPKVESMLPEDFSTKHSIGSIIQSDSMRKFKSEILDPIGSIIFFEDLFSD